VPLRIVRPDLPDGLDAVELVRVRLPLVEPFVASHGVEHERDLVLVRAIGTDGIEGWGECDALSAATYTAEDSESAWRVLRTELVANVLAGVRDASPDHPMARAAIEGALLDLQLRRSGTALAAHVGASRGAVDGTAVIGRQPSIDRLLEVVAERRDERATLVKHKIAPGWGLEPQRAVRSTFPDLRVAADANGAYTTDDVDLVHAIDELGLDYLEEPYALGLYGNLVGIILRRNTPIALDESITAARDLDHWASPVDFRGIVNVKAARVGGVAEAVQVIHRCAELGFGAFIGGMLEAGVGRAVGLALAGIDTLTHPTDLGPSSRYFADDITEPFELSADGSLPVPQGPGIGVVPRAERIDALAVDRVVVRP
jgi:O-succinylbenzoate synthase